jgi:acyl dehydratase
MHKYLPELLSVGQVIDLGSWYVTREQIVNYARQWDPLPVHLDGDVIGSTGHTLSIVQRLMSDAFYSQVPIVGAVGMSDARVLGPLRPNTTVHGVATITSIDPQEATFLVALHVTLDSEHPLTALDETLILARSPASLINS